MRKSTALMLTLLLLLQACTTAPRVLVQTVCPPIPPLEQRPAALEPSFTETMRSFLVGKVPEPSALDLTWPSAKLPMVQPAKP